MFKVEKPPYQLSILLFHGQHQNLLFFSLNFAYSFIYTCELGKNEL